MAGATQSAERLLFFDELLALGANGFRAWLNRAGPPDMALSNVRAAGRACPIIAHESHVKAPIGMSTVCRM
jgi:hypothetical protein